MPHFTLQISHEGPLLTIFVGVSEGRRKALGDAGKKIPALAKISALIDTGASVTCLELQAIANLGLTPTGNIKITTPSTGREPVNVDQYDVALFIPPASDDQPPFILRTLPVVCINESSFQGYQALIGRDILKHCLFSYNGSMNLFTLAF